MYANRAVVKRAGWRAAGIALGAGVLLAVAGCTSAQLSDVYEDPSFQGPPLRSVLVVSQHKDDVQRRLWEDEINFALRDQGVIAISSYTVDPKSIPSQDDLETMVAEQHLDGALIVKPLQPGQETHFVPGWTSVHPVDYYNPWSGRTVIAYRDRYHPGYVYSDRVLRQQVTVWSAGNGAKMIWAGTVEVENPDSRDQLRHDLATRVAPELRKYGVME